MGDIVYSYGLIVRRYCILQVTHSYMESALGKIPFSLLVSSAGIGVQGLPQARQVPHHTANPGSQRPLSTFLPVIQHFLMDSVLAHYQRVMGFLSIINPVLSPITKNDPFQTGISASEWTGDNLKHRRSPAHPKSFPTCPAAPTVLPGSAGVFPQADISELQRAVFSFSGVWAPFEVGKEWRTSLSLYLYLHNHREPRW